MSSSNRYILVITEYLTCYCVNTHAWATWVRPQGSRLRRKQRLGGHGHRELKGSEDSNASRTLRTWESNTHGSQMLVGLELRRCKHRWRQSHSEQLMHEISTWLVENTRKTTGVHRLQTITMWEEYKWMHRGNNLVLTIFARWRLKQKMLRISLSLTHTLSLSITVLYYSYKINTSLTL